VWSLPQGLNQTLPTNMDTPLPSSTDRIKAASFAFTTILTSPLYALPTASVGKAASLFVTRMKEASVRRQGIKQIILDHKAA